MNYEKIYKEALEKAKKELKVCGSMDCDAAKQIFRFFPELKISEDERIIKEIIEFLQLPHQKFVGERNQEEWIEWLQKQNEKTLTIDVDSMVEAYRQKHLNQGIAFKNSSVINMCVNMCVADYKRGIENTLDKLHLKQSEQNSTPKFKVGDWIVFNNDHDSIYQVEKIENYEYTLRHILGGSMCLSFSHENMIRAWTIEDAKDGDVLANKYGAIFINAGSSNGGGTLDCYCYLSPQNKFCIEEHKTGSWFYKNEIKPATMKQRNFLFLRMKEEGYEWDANKKELKKIEQNSTNSYCEEHCKGFQETGKCFADGECKAKRDAEHNPTWSEEDKKIMKQIDSLLYCQCTIHSSMYEKLHNWLKSLKPQPQWKPTAEQMQSLYFAIITYSKKDDCKLTYDSLNSLYDNLKKL